MIYVHLCKEKSRIYGFLVWPNLHYMLQSPGNAVSLEWEGAGAWKLSLSLVSFFLFSFSSSSHLLTNSITFCPCHFFSPPPASLRTRQQPSTHAHTHIRTTEGSNTSNLTHAGALCTQTHTRSHINRELLSPSATPSLLSHQFSHTFSFSVSSPLSFSRCASLRTSALNRLHI